MGNGYAPRLLLGLLLQGLTASTSLLHATPLASCIPPPNSNIGCEFYAVSLPNPLTDQTTFHFGVAMLNPGAAPVDVTVTGGALGSPDMFSLPAGSSVTTQLP